MYIWLDATVGQAVHSQQGSKANQNNDSGNGHNRLLYETLA